MRPPPKEHSLGDMAEQVDAGDLKSPDFGRVGSIPSIPTKRKR